MSATAEVREPDLAELLADTAYAKRLSDLYDRAVLARDSLRLIEQRNARSLKLAREEYKSAAAALAAEIARARGVGAEVRAARQAGVRP